MSSQLKFQVDLQQSTVVTGMLTQGDPESESWVLTFNIWISEDCENFNPVLNKFGKKAIYTGNFDQNSVVTTLFPFVIVSRCLRLVPRKIHGKHPAMRFEMLGCNVDYCKQSIIHHLDFELYNVSTSHNLTFKDYPASESTLPTITTMSYAEFKFDMEHIVFGIVLYINGEGTNFVMTYSRNCHKWDPLREKQGYGDPHVFKFKSPRFKTRLLKFDYPIRAQCFRLIPLDYPGGVWKPKANFLGCGTGQSILRRCGLQKVVHHRAKRVVGGQPADVGWWPWLASLEVSHIDANNRRNLSPFLLSFF